MIISIIFGVLCVIAVAFLISASIWGKRKKEIEQCRAIFNEPEKEFPAPKKPTGPYASPMEQRVNETFAEYVDAYYLYRKECAHAEFLKRRREAQLKLKIPDEEGVTEAEIASCEQTAEALRQDVETKRHKPLPSPEKYFAGVDGLFGAFKEKLSYGSPRLTLIVNEYVDFYFGNGMQWIQDETKTNYLTFTEYGAMMWMTSVHKFRLFRYCNIRDVFCKYYETTETLPAGRHLGSNDEVAEIHYLHERKGGGPDLRYNYNPSTYSVYRGILTFLIDLNLHFKLKYLDRRVAEDGEQCFKRMQEAYSSLSNRCLIDRIMRSETEPDLEKLAHENELAQRTFQRAVEQENKRKAKLAAQKKAEEEEAKRQEEVRKKQLLEQQAEERRLMEEERARERLAAEAERRRQAEEAAAKKLAAERAKAEEAALKSLMDAMSKEVQRCERRPYGDMRFTEEEVRLVIDARQAKVQAEEEARREKKRHEASLKYDGIGEPPFRQEGENRTVTNNLFTFSYVWERDESGQFELFFVSEEGDTVSRCSVCTGGSAGERFQCSFELLPNISFDPEKTYYLLVKRKDGAEIVGKSAYKINIAFTSDFDF